jgi:hypothetical protein
MSPERYTTPLSIIEVRADNRQKCPCCRWETHSFYRLDSWPVAHAGCASCVLEALANDDEYLIHHTRGPTSIPTPRWTRATRRSNAIASHSTNRATTRFRIVIDPPIC